MTSTDNIAAAGGRLLMSAVFLLTGVEKLAGFGGTVGFMAHEGLPLPGLVASVAIIVECVGGLLVLVGYQTRVASLVLAVWCVATALVAHAHFNDPNQTIHFLKNVVMAGGFLQLAAFGASAWSIDAQFVPALRRV